MDANEQLAARTSRVIDYLLRGGRVTIGEYTYMLDMNYHFCAVGYNHTRQEETLLKVGFGSFTLHEFILLVRDMTEVEYAQFAFNIVRGQGS